ncbi:TonB-dependent receptor family protein [bacterium]|nr:TonB-dependent receptor family protein [bacterium]
MCFSLNMLFSQDYTLSGTVRNTDDTPIEFANVFLLNRDYSILIRGTTTDENGKFQLRVDAGTYFLKASYIEAESEPFLLEVFKDIDTLSIILNNSQQLDEVVVTQQKPTIERKVDRLVFNVENTALADGDIWDVLKRTPNLLIVNDQLTIKGNGAVGILINGRKVNIPERDIINLLSGTSAGNIESVEVITNPPAKYSAEGGMLVNIVLKKTLIAGYNGAVYNKYRQGVFAKHTLGTDHFFRGNKTAFSVNYSFSKNKLISRYTDNTSFLEDDVIVSKWVSEENVLRRRQQHNISAFFDYDINDKNRLSLSTINLFQPQLDSENNSETLIGNASGVTQSSFTTLNRSAADQLNTSLYLDYVRSLEKGAELSFNTHFTYYDTSRPQIIDTDFFDVDGTLTGENDFITNAEQRTDLFSLQVDYVRPLNEQSKFETGVRYASINSESTISQEGFDTGQPGLNPTERGNFTYNEDIYAAYVGFNKRGKLLRLNAGLRAEYAETIGDLDIASQATERSNLEFFPSFSVQYLPSKKHNLKLSYYRRITRPRYNSVNPFQIFLTNNSVIEGEPNLLPATRNYISGGYTYNKGYTLELFYRNEKNPFRQFFQQDNADRIFITKTANFDRNVNYGIDLIINKKPTRFWDFYVLASYYSVQYNFIDPDSSQNIENRRWTYKLQTNNTFTLLADKTLFLDVDFRFYSDIPIGNLVLQSFNDLNLGLRKSLWDKKASVSMGLTDVFNQGNQLSVRQYANQNNTSLSRPENRLFTFGFRYKFGNTGIKANKKSKRLDERNRL